MLYWVLCQSCAAYALMTWANRVASASLVSGYSALQPVTAAVLAAVAVALVAAEVVMDAWHPVAAEAGMGPGDQEYRAQYLLDELGLTGREDPSNLSGGEARRAYESAHLYPYHFIRLWNHAAGL